MTIRTFTSRFTILFLLGFSAELLFLIYYASQNDFSVSMVIHACQSYITKI